jgi:hypothetical protein
MNLLRQRPPGTAPRGNEMEFDATAMLLFGGAKAGVSQIRCNPSAIGACATSEHDTDAINQAVVGLADLLRAADKQFFDEQFKSRSQCMQAAVDTLIGGQTWKPVTPMIVDVIINPALGGQSLEMPEQVHG